MILISISCLHTTRTVTSTSSYSYYNMTSENQEENSENRINSKHYMKYLLHKPEKKEIKAVSDQESLIPHEWMALYNPPTSFSQMELELREASEFLKWQ